MDTTRYAKPRPCLPSLQRSRVGRARAVSLDEVSDRSLSRDDLVWETRMCLRPSTAPSIDDLGFDEEDLYGEGEVEGSFENNRKALEDDGEDIFPQDESVKGVEALVLTEAPAVLVTPPVTPRSLPQPLSLSGAKYLATRVLTRPRHAAVVALDRVVAVIFTQRTLDAIGRRDAHVLSTIVRAASSSGHDQL